MPLTKSGKEVMAAMKKEYGDKKGEQVFYASRNAHKAGSSKWEGKKKSYSEGAVKEAKRMRGA